MEEISHKDIYDRLIAVEDSVKKLTDGTTDMLSAFNAAKGAFTVLEWLAKVVKPIIYLGTLAGVVYSLFHGVKQ